MVRKEFIIPGNDLLNKYVAQAPNIGISIALFKRTVPKTGKQDMESEIV